ncbi:MAG: hydrogenase nickel incorporation protein HypB [Bacteroidota bacterium]
MNVITVERKVLEKNDVIARRNRAFFERTGMTAINLVSSPGAGKTTILERTLERLRGSIPIGVIEGDLQTDLDARRVAAFGVPVVQIVTNGGCHLDAGLVEEALGRLPAEGLRLLFIENVGNLVCPANFDLGERMKVVIASTTEGEDKPLKYPGMFRNAAALVINKTDLLPYLSCPLGVLRENALRVNPALVVFETSGTTGEGINPWCDWLTALTEGRP